MVGGDKGGPRRPVYWIYVAANPLLRPQQAGEKRTLVRTFDLTVIVREKWSIKIKDDACFTVIWIVLIPGSTRSSSERVSECKGKPATDQLSSCTRETMTVVPKETTPTNRLWSAFPERVGFRRKGGSDAGHRLMENFMIWFPIHIKIHYIPVSLSHRPKQLSTSRASPSHRTHQSYISQIKIVLARISEIFMDASESTDTVVLREFESKSFLFRGSVCARASWRKASTCLRWKEYWAQSKHFTFSSGPRRKDLRSFRQTLHTLKWSMNTVQNTWLHDSRAL